MSLKQWETKVAAYEERYSSRPLSVLSRYCMRCLRVSPSGIRSASVGRSRHSRWMAIPPDFAGQVDIVARLAPNVTIDMARAGLFALI